MNLPIPKPLRPIEPQGRVYTRQVNASVSGRTTVSSIKRENIHSDLVTYGFHRIVRVAVKGNAPEKILSVAGRRWLAAKAKHYGYNSIVLRDLHTIADRIAQKERGENQMVDLVDIALWKENLTPRYYRHLFAVEQIMVARIGEEERAIYEVDIFGSPDDQLLVHAEVALLKKTRDENVSIHLARLTEVARTAQPETVELVAERIASDFPDVSLGLCKCIPVPRMYFDIGFRELPSPGRCIYRTFIAISERDLGQAKKLRRSLSDPVERLQAGLGIVHTVLHNSPSELKSYIAELVGDPAISDVKLSIAHTVGIFIIKEGAFLPTSEYIRLLGDLWEVVDMTPITTWILSAIDSCINRSVPDVISGIADLGQCDFYYLLYWRLQVAGVDTSGLRVSEDSLIGRDLLRANEAISVVESSFEQAHEIACSITTAIGAVHVLVGMAKQVKKSDWDLGQALLSAAIGQLENCFTANFWPLRLDVLRQLVLEDGPFRNDAVSEAVANLGKLTPLVLRRETAVELGRCIALAFSDFSSKELSFLVHVYSCCNESEYNTSIQSGIVNALSQTACKNLGELLLKGPPTNSDAEEVPSGFTELSCDASFMAQIAEHAVQLDHQLGTLLFQKSAELVVTLKDDKNRNMVARDVIACALRAAPELAMDICRNCKCQEVTFTQAAERVLLTLANRASGRRTCWLRLSVGLLVEHAALTSGQPVDWQWFDCAHNAAKITHDPLAIEMNLPFRISPDWRRNIVRAFREYITAADDRYKCRLNNAMEHLATLDWALFMAIVGDEAMARDALDLVDKKRLTKSILRTEADPEELLPEIKYVQSVLEEETGDSPVEEFHNWLLAWGAANSPEFAAQKIATLSADKRTRLVSHLKHLTLKHSWNVAQISSVARSLDYSDNANELTSCARLLSYLCGRSPIEAGWGDSLYAAACRCENAQAQFNIAESLQFVFPKVAAKLTIESLKRAKNEHDSETLFNVLAHTRSTVQCKDAKNTSGSRTYRVSMQQRLTQINDIVCPLSLNADHAAELLSKLEIEEKPLLVVLRSASQVVRLESIADVMSLCKSVAGNKAVPSDAREEFTTLLLLRSVRENMCTWNQMSDLDLDHTAKVDALIDLASDMDGHQKEEIYLLAVREAMRLSPIKQASRLYRLGNITLDKHPSASCSLYMRSLERCCSHTNAFMLMTTVLDVVETGLRHRKLACLNLAEKLRQIADRDWFDSHENVSFPDWNIWCQMAAAVMQWSYDPKQLKNLWDGKWTRDIRTFGLAWEWFVIKIYLALQQFVDLAAAEEFLQTFLSPLSREAARDIAKRTVLFAVAADHSNRPLACYRVWRGAPNREHFHLVRSLLTKCDKSTAAVAHLSFAICGGQNGVLVDKHEVDMAWDLLKADPSVGKSPNIKRYLPTVYAVAHGVQGAIESLLEMLKYSQSKNMNLPGITLAAIDSSKSPEQLLQKIWSRTQRPYDAVD